MGMTLIPCPACISNDVLSVSDSEGGVRPPRYPPSVQVIKRTFSVVKTSAIVKSDTPEADCLNYDVDPDFGGQSS